MRTGRPRIKRPPITVPDDPSVLLVPLTKGAFAIIDADDAWLVEQDAWFAHRKHAGLYAARSVHAPGKAPQMEPMHRRIGDAMGIPRVLLVDHKNGNTLDNRRQNLRAATNAQNVVNSNRRKVAASGVRGVYYSKSDEKWRAHARIDGRQVHLGTFSTFAEAASASLSARAQAHGEFCPDA